MSEDDYRELETLRQLMDMRVYVTDDDRLQCSFVGCLCGDSDLNLPGRRVTLRDVAERMMEHRVDNLFVGARVIGRSES
jgi:hypothetical protein